MANPPPSKSSLRQTHLDRRMQIPPEAQKASAAQACDIFFKHVSVPPGAVVAGYWPIRGEMDVMPVLRKLLEREYACVLPCISEGQEHLVFRFWNEATLMKNGKFNISEPSSDWAIVPDIILVPMVAFDKTGHRLGYGAGFYDRTVAHIKERKPVVTIGIAYEGQICDELPIEDHDMRMNMIVTDRNFYK